MSFRQRGYGAMFALNRTDRVRLSAAEALFDLQEPALHGGHSMQH